MAGAIDHVVDALVEFHQGRTMLLEAARFKCRQIPQEVVDFGEVILVAASRRQPRRERLELLSNLANGPQISRIHPRDEHAAPRVDVDEVLGCQRPNRLADRRSPHAQLLAQFGLADDRPGLQLSSADHAPNLPIRLVGEGLRGRGHKIDISVTATLVHQFREI